MTWKEFCKLYAQYQNVNIDQAHQLCGSVFEFLQKCIEELKPGEKIHCYGLGSFGKKTVSERKSADVNSGAIRTIPSHDKITFTRWRGTR